MPFKSKAQQRFMFAAAARGDLPKSMPKEWAAATPNIKKLPNRVTSTRNSSTSATTAPRVTAPAKKLPTRGTKPRKAGGPSIPKQRTAGVRSVNRK